MLYGKIHNERGSKDIETDFKGVYSLAEAVRCNNSLQTIVLEGGVLPVHQLKGLNAKTKMLDL